MSGPRAKLRAGLRVGLLGGSFNPAHAGHLHVSRAALARLALDELWWLVSPGNPLKDPAGLAPLDERLATARTVAAAEPRITVSDLERRLGTRFTLDTLRRLHEAFPHCHFVWLIGADNLIQFPRWRGWREIFRTVPIAVFPRPTYSIRARNCRAARRFARARLRPSAASRLADRTPPAWVVLKVSRHPESATRIRARSARWKTG